MAVAVVTTAAGAAGASGSVGQAVAFFRSKGVPDYVIAGIVANLLAESSLNPGAYNAGEGAVGIAQWEGNRDDEMRAWTREHGLDSNSLNGQLNYLWHEMNTSESGGWHQVLATSNAYDAGYAWAEHYERAAHYSNGVDQYATRAQRAGQIGQAGFGSVAGSSPGTGANAGQGTGGPAAQGGGNGGGGLTGVGGGQQHPVTRAGYEARLGAMGDLLSSVPELNNLLNQAITHDWSVERLRQAVENSNWYQNHSATARSVLAQQMSDPATYESNLSRVEGTITQQANSMGFTLDDKTIESIAKSALLSGNDNVPAVDVAGDRPQRVVRASDGHQHDLQGGMAQTADQLQSLAAAYGVHISDTRLARQAKQVVTGSTTIDTFKNNYIEAARSRFPGLSSQLDQGMTVSDVAQPYISSMAGLLEVNPNSLSLNTPRITAALQGTQGQSADKGSVPTMTPIWQFEQQVRKDPRWGFTRNAHDSISNVLSELGADWGFAS
jgi:hypothetical protein